MIFENIASSDVPSGYLSADQERKRKEKIERKSKNLQASNNKCERGLLADNIALLRLPLCASLSGIPRAIRARDPRLPRARSRPDDELLAAAGAEVLRVVSPLVLGVGAHSLQLRHAVLVGQVLGRRTGALDRDSEAVASPAGVANAFLCPG